MTATLHTLGFDVSLSRTGYAALTYDTGELAGVGFCATDATDPLPVRLAQIRDFTRARIDCFDALGGVDVAVESGFMARSGSVTRKLAMAWGVAVLAMYDRLDVQPHEVAPTAVKALATGKGNARKDAVVEAAVARWGVDVADPDIADACWVAEHGRLEMQRLYPESV